MEYRLSAVYIDDPTKALPAYVAIGDDWNGFALPVFTREQADAWMAWQGTVRGYTASYDLATDSYYSHHTSEDPDVWDGVVMVIDGVPRCVYPIGAGYWCWDEVEIPREEKRMYRILTFEAKGGEYHRTIGRRYLQSPSWGDHDETTRYDCEEDAATAAKLLTVPWRVQCWIDVRTKPVEASYWRDVLDWTEVAGPGSGLKGSI